MTEKTIAKNLINALPAKITMDGIMHALYVQAKFRRGESEIRKNGGVSHDEAKRRLRKWLK